MAGVITNDGKLEFLKHLARELDGAPTKGPLNDCKLKLFTNDLLPAPGTVLADLTEADFGGYAEKTLGDWGEEYMDEENKPAVANVSQQFNASGVGDPDSVYGWYLTDNAEAKLFYLEKFAAPIPMGTAVQSLIVLPKMVL